MTSLGHNAPEFVATGAGFHNRAPNFQATSANANGRLHNLGLGDGDRNQMIYLFISEISTGWNVQGDYGQSAKARTWYPMHLSQDEVTIKGVCANQYEYDRIVEFIRAHHLRAVTPHNNPHSSAVELRLLPDRIKKGVDRKGQPVYETLHPGLTIEGYVETIRAGHERFVFAPAWEMALKVTYDFDQDRYNGDYDAHLNNWIETFGSGKPPFFKAKNVKVEQPNVSNSIPSTDRSPNIFDPTNNFANVPDIWDLTVQASQGTQS